MISIERNNRTAWMTDDGTVMGDGTLQTYLRTSMKSLSRSSGDPHIALARKLEQDKLVNVVAVRALSDAPKFIMGTAKLKMFTHRLRSITLKHGKHDQSSHGRRGSGGGGGLAPAKPGSRRVVNNEILPMVDDIPAGSKGQPRSPEAVALAKQYRDRYVAAEPRITADMKAIADAAGMTFEHTDQRIKSTESLARKIDKESAEQDKPREKVAEDMADVIRFTMVTPTAEYVDNVKSTIAQMESLGYGLRIKNYWTQGDPYQGINVAMTSPTGEKIEMQFHSDVSTVVKEPVHRIYGVYRESKVLADRQRMYDEMAALSMDIPLPPGDLMGIGDIKFVPRDE
jgi:hypothetical protein